MIFGYNELKEFVREDFERFYNWGFDEKQILPAVLNEYESGEGFCRTENICIYIFLIICYQKKGFSFQDIIQKLELLLTEEAQEAQNEASIALGNEYAKYRADLDRVLRIK